jgi:hypothetical protein
MELETKIEYKPTDEKSFDGKCNSRVIMDEFGQMVFPKTRYGACKNIQPKKIEPLVFSLPKKKISKQ